MKASATQTQLHSHLALFSHARWRPDSNDGDGFGSLLSQFGIPSGRRSSTAAAPSAAIPEPTVQAQATVALAPATHAEVNPPRPVTPAPQAAAITVPAVTPAPQAAAITVPAVTPAPRATVSTAQTAASTPASTASSAADSAPTGTEAARNSGGRGLTTASGAPLIVLNSQPSRAYSYLGPASYNPYYITPDCPYQAGNVTGYSKWFQTIGIGGLGPTANTLEYNVDPRFSANLEGGEEALRLVQQFVPGAQLAPHEWPCQLPGQPLNYDVKLPDGRTLDGGLILSYYYHEGWGVTDDSDAMLEQFCGISPPDATAT